MTNLREDTMTDTLREGLAEVVAVKRAEYRIYRTAAGGWAVQMTGEPYTVVHSNDVFEDCEAFVSEQVADAAIAFIATWALEPAQVEKAARGIDPTAYAEEAPFPPAMVSDLRENATADARAAIAALFERKTT